MAFSPAYATTAPSSSPTRTTSGDIRVARYRANAARTRALAGSRRILLTAEHSAHGNHNGGQLAFGPDGRLYASVGDGGGGCDPGGNAQRLSTRLGKLLSIHPGNIRRGWRLEGYGLRNLWRFSFDRLTGRLYAADVGQGAWEEVNTRAATALGGRPENYGWDVYEGRAASGCATTRADPAGPARLARQRLQPLARLLGHGRFRLPGHAAHPRSPRLVLLRRLLLGDDLAPEGVGLGATRGRPASGARHGPRHHFLRRGDGRRALRRHRGRHRLQARPLRLRYQFVDCRWELGNPGRGRELYLGGPRPGRVVSRRGAASCRRRPPRRAGGTRCLRPRRLRASRGRAGIGPGVFVVAYDQGMDGGAARLWWLLRHFGHEDVAVLAGGLESWAGPLRSGEEEIEPAVFTPSPRSGDTIEADELARTARRGRPRRPRRARSRALPRGGGAHRPGCGPHSRARATCLTPDAADIPPELLEADELVVYCGSGITACVDLLALARAGRPDAKLYPGSWSDWSGRGLPVERG